ncbi:hypothetical protein AMTR_s00002p00271120 [Amborella trichopoda]|uniref:Uncharacterized protein n=1 Tax=Amborella trichopoda TaxID=13333 RepID=W1P3J7_AMBTC|nr:hypothetical protein AMTR_s00002p00271120 [Amborella trichopoda]
MSCYTYALALQRRILEDSNSLGDSSGDRERERFAKAEEVGRGRRDRQGRGILLANPVKIPNKMVASQKDSVCETLN